MVFMGLGLVAFVTGAIIYDKAGKDEKSASHKEQLKQMVETAAEDGVLTQRERAKIENQAKKLGLNHKVFLEKAEKLAREHKGENETQIIDPFKKAGDDFEGYVVKKFSKKYCTSTVFMRKRHFIQIYSWSLN